MIFLFITKFIITTEGVFLLHTEQDKKQIKIITLGELNRRAEDIDTFIGTSEKQYSDKIAAAADSIAQCHKQKPLVLLSGPSGSGKTTTAYRIADALVKKGIKAIVISMDDYFVPGVIPPDENGRVDFEAPARVDCELLKKDLRTLAAGGEVRLPKFNFADNSRQHGNAIPMRRQHGSYNRGHPCAQSRCYGQDARQRNVYLCQRPYKNSR